ncbi:MAG: hypothetical protein NT154_42030 [Verrucomicrobia bacterium]|nr:hypothetical protein [Verrucomicrobiota bacterium]
MSLVAGPISSFDPVCGKADFLYVADDFAQKTKVNEYLAMAPPAHDPSPEPIVASQAK